MESKGSLPYVQKPAAGPYPEPDESNSHTPTLFLQHTFCYYTSIYAWIFRMTSSFQVLQRKFCMPVSSLPC
jgi:hypothetical protein